MAKTTKAAPSVAPIKKAHTAAAKIISDGRIELDHLIQQQKTFVHSMQGEFKADLATWIAHAQNAIAEQVNKGMVKHSYSDGVKLAKYIHDEMHKPLGE